LTTACRRARWRFAATNTYTLPMATSGGVQGLVVDPADHHITRVLLQEGHLWGKHQIAIPIGAVTDVTDDGVRLKLTKDEVRDLPSVELADQE
jgi:hypothetical protein